MSKVINLGNEENGGITNPEDYISKDPAFSNRITLQVFLTDATSTFKGNRYFIDQNFRVNKTIYIPMKKNYCFLHI